MNKINNDDLHNIQGGMSVNDAREYLFDLMTEEGWDAANNFWPGR